MSDSNNDVVGVIETGVKSKIKVLDKYYLNKQQLDLQCTALICHTNEIVLQFDGKDDQSIAI